MPSYFAEAQLAGFDHTSPFHDLAQLAIKHYYLIPYPIKSANPHPVVHRPWHGRVHASRAALNLEMFLALYEKYASQMLKNNDGSPLNSQQIKLLKLAALYHDSANESEIYGSEENHAKNFSTDMTLLGFDKQDIEAIAYGIRYKDGLERGYKYQPKGEKSPKNLFQKLIHDADCLDIMRMNVQFDMTHLDIYKDLYNDHHFLSDLKAIVKNHQETMNRFALNPHEGGIGELHQWCESAANCYLAVRSAHYDILLEHIIVECFKRGQTIFLEDIPHDTFSILDTYLRTNSLSVEKVIEQLSKQINHPMSSSVHHDTIEVYSDTGCLIRGLLDPSMDEELNQLGVNEMALNTENIASVDDLRNYLKQQEMREEKVFTPKGFKWRPSIYAHAGITIQRFSHYKLGIIIDPTHPKTIAPYFFKQNAISSRANTGHFKYEQKTGCLKNKNDPQGMLKKTIEMEQRRQGILEDRNLHYYGSDALSSNEVLSTYNKESISGIVIFETHDKSTIDHALLLRAKLGKPARSFYRFSTMKGLVPVNESEIQKFVQTTEELKSAINQFIMTPSDAISISANIPGTLTLQKDQSSKPMTLPSISREIQIKIEGMSNENMSLIRETIKQIQKSCPDNPYDAKTTIAKIDVMESVGHITVKIESFECETTEELDMFIKLGVLGRIQHNLFEGELLPTDQENLPTAEERTRSVSLKDIANICCVSNGHSLSEDNPLKFKFTHPADENIVCFAWVKSGRPILEFFLPDGEVVTQKTDLLPKIARRYYQQQLDRLQIILNEPNTKRWLDEHKLSHLKIELTDTYLDKIFISISVQFMSSTEQPVVTLISELLGMDETSKLSSKNVSENIQCFTASNIAQIDQFEESIRRVCHLPSTHPEGTSDLDKTLQHDNDNSLKMNI